MAGHAPDLLPTNRWLRWIADISDARLSFYMLVLAVVIATLFYVVDQLYFS